MPEFKELRNSLGEIEYIETSLTGHDLLSNPKLNKGCAFPIEERKIFNLEGLLPNQIETLPQQVARMYAQYHEHHSNLGKNIYLNVLYDYNETLFYKLVSQHLEEMLPIVYTPTVGEAVEHFSLELRKPRGLYLSYPERNQMEKMLKNGLPSDTDLVVVTDGEAVLGIGDQGIGGIKICNAKLMVYTLSAGLNPHHHFPIQLDVGTNNHHLLNDPMYLGWRHERISGQAYDDFIDQFVTLLHKKFPNIYLHWEDFGRDHARKILNHYREKICTINGDIQSTGAITLACILAGCKASGIKLVDQNIIIFGAGTAGVGIADQLCAAMRLEGMSETEACSRFWLLDKEGLLIEGKNTLLPFQKKYARNEKDIASWELFNFENIKLLDVVKNIKSTALIGTSAVGGTFTEEIVKIMAQKVERPIILPLSNPTVKSEATPDDLSKWTHGKAIVATGSPFPGVSQSNNAYAFPGIGLGAIAVKAKKLTDEMIWQATQAICHYSPVSQDQNVPLLPKVSEIKELSFKVALAVAKQAQAEGVASIKHDNLEVAIKKMMWEPKYYAYRLK